MMFHVVIGDGYVEGRHVRNANKVKSRSVSVGQKSIVAEMSVPLDVSSYNFYQNLTQ